MAHWDKNAFLEGMISGYTSAQDRSVSEAANNVASTPEEADGSKEGVNYSQGKNSGTRYSLIDDSRPNELMYMLAHTANAYIGGKDMGESLNTGAEAAQNLRNKAWRSRQAADLDEQGYDPIGIKTWVESGDNKDLVTGAGQMIVNVDGKNVRMDAKDAIDYKKSILPVVSKVSEHKEYNASTGQTDIVYRDEQGNETQRIAGGGTETMSPYQQAELENTRQSHAETVRHDLAGEEAAQAKANADSSGQYTTTADKAKAASEFRQDSKKLTDDVNLRVSAAGQINTAALQHKNGNTFADQSLMANFQKIEAPNLSPRASQNEHMLSQVGSSTNSLQRTYDKVVSGQSLSDEDVKNINLIGQVSADDAYIDWQENYGDQRKELVSHGVNDERLVKPAKPRGFDQRHPEFSQKTTTSGNNVSPRTVTIGQTINGFRFKGGDPKDQNNWEAAQ